MSAPTDHELEDKKRALLDRSLSFLRRATVELVDSPADSVIHFAAGMELLLKARLFSEHWTLILEKPHDHEWRNIWNPGGDGKVKTVAAGRLIAAVEKVTGAKLKGLAAPFETIRSFRNQAMHLLIHQEDTRRIAVAQWSCWHQAYLLIGREWQGAFGDSFAEKAKGLNDELVKENRPYIDERFEELQKMGAFIKAKRENRVVECPDCRLVSAELQASDPKEVFPCMWLRPCIAECYPCLAKSFWATLSDGPSACEWFKLSEVNVICPYCEEYGSIYQIEVEREKRGGCFSAFCREKCDIGECACCGSPIVKRLDDSWCCVGTRESGCPSCS